MSYNKPEITVLGSASEVIEQTGQKTGSTSDGFTNPAYDLDE